jgi:hypothetical protein
MAVIKTSSWFTKLPADHCRIGISRGDEETPLTAGLPFNFRKRYNDFSRRACIRFGHGLEFEHWHAGPKALTVKATVPTLCTPLFPKIQHAELSPTLKARGFPACE